jgi:hypothetical protein
MAEVGQVLHCLPGPGLGIDADGRMSMGFGAHRRKDCDFHNPSHLIHAGDTLS